MVEVYKKTISQLIDTAPFFIDTEIKIAGNPPTMAGSEFLTNKEQGDWAEQVVLNAINENTAEYIAVHYGRSDSLAAGDIGFNNFYREYQDELNRIGKKPDILLFHRTDISSTDEIDLSNDEFIRKAVAAIEVRSSSFLANKYAKYMEERTQRAEQECLTLRDCILTEPFSTALLEKSPDIHRMITTATATTFRELDFRLRSWSTTETLKTLSEYLKSLKEKIKILHKRDYLSITPKVEDIALVNRWIQFFGVKHFYLQVFFDKAYIIPFKNILEICSNPAKEDVVFSVERDVKNQGKTTIKINVQVGREILARIDMPTHVSAMKELDRGRLLFYVTFEGGKGYLDMGVLHQEITNHG